MPRMLSRHNVTTYATLYTIARIRFVEPIDDIERLVVLDAKYVVNAHPQSLNMFDLLVPENSPEFVSQVIRDATNAQADNK